MAAAETAKLVASLDLKDNLSAGVTKASRSLGKLESTSFKVGQNIGRGLNTAGHNIKRFGTLAAVGIGGAIAVAVHSGVESLAELEDATSSVDGAIAQLGLTGKLSSAQIAQWANEIEASTQAAFDDKAITQAAASLIRFGGVTTQNLRPALVVMTDLAAKTGDVDSAAQLLGKSLADPTKAAGRLARSGVILTKEEQKRIAQLVKSGKIGKAQAAVLDLIAKKTKGAAAASAGPYRDALNILGDVTEDAQRALSIGFLPLITKVADVLSTQLAKPEVINSLKEFGTSLAGGLEKAVDFIAKLDFKGISNALRTAAGFAGSIIDAFLKAPTWLQTAIVTGWGLNKLTGGAVTDIFGTLASGLIKGVLGMNAGVVNINAGVVNGGGGGGLPTPVKLAAGAAATAGGISALAVGTLILAPAAVAVLGVALTNALDPTHSRQLTGQSKTASGRGIPDWNNAALQQLKNIAQNTNPAAPQPRGAEALKDSFDRAQVSGAAPAIDELKGKIADDLAVQTGAIDSAGRTTSSAASNAGVMAANASRSAGAQVASAIAANRPITNVDINISATTVQQVATVQTRYGSTGGDRLEDSQDRRNIR